MPPNDELLNVVQAFHAKMDSGFARLHERIDASKDELADLRNETERHTLKLDNVLTEHLTHHPPAENCPNDSLVKRHLTGHPSNNDLAEVVKRHKEVAEDKRKVVRVVAEWTFKGIIFAVMVKLGLEKYWPW